MTTEQTLQEKIDDGEAIHVNRITTNVYDDQIKALRVDMASADTHAAVINIDRSVANQIIIRYYADAAKQDLTLRITINTDSAGNVSGDILRERF